MTKIDELKARIKQLEDEREHIFGLRNFFFLYRILDATSLTNHFDKLHSDKFSILRIH
mgnify:CR=1 FL=1